MSIAFEAACYDQRGHLVLWRHSAGGWHQMAQSTCPPDSADGPPSYDEHGVGVEGAVLPGMSDAVFIVTGPFSGDGTGNAVAFGNGPDGWGLLVQSGVSQCVRRAPGAVPPTPASTCRPGSPVTLWKRRSTRGHSRTPSDPASPSAACASKGMCAADATSATAHVTAGAQVRTAYPVVAEGRQKLITGPLWPLAGIAQSLWGEDSKTSFQPLETSPGGCRTRGATPWYIPATLHAPEFRVGQGAPVEITFRNRSLTGVVLMAPAE